MICLLNEASGVPLMRRVDTYGFPFPAYTRRGWTAEKGYARSRISEAMEVLLSNGRSPDSEDALRADQEVRGHEVAEASDQTNIACNIATSGFCLLATTLLFEYLIRGRSKS